MARRSATAIVWFELSGYFRGGNPWRFLPLVPAAAFLAIWTYGIAPPFAGVIWLAAVGIEPRVNNMLYQHRNELEAFTLLPSDWRRIVLAKNLSTVLLGGFGIAALSTVTLYFSPGLPTLRETGDALLYLSTVCFPVLSLGNEASVRYPRRTSGGIAGGLTEAVWMSLALLAVSVPFVLFTALAEMPWLCVPYMLFTAGTWYFRSVTRTASMITFRRNEIWQKTESLSNS